MSDVECEPPLKKPRTEEGVAEEPPKSDATLDSTKYDNYVSPEELEKLKEFLVLDEVKSTNGDSNDEDSDSSDGKSEGLPEDEIERMLEEDLPEGFKGAPKVKERPYITRQKIVLEEKGVNHFEVLPLDWMMVRHYSGMPVYMHRASRVCTLSKPYFLGKGNTRRHDIPISAIPCLAYRRALEEEKKQKEIDRKIEEQIKNGTWMTNGNAAEKQAGPKENSLSKDMSSEKRDTDVIRVCPFKRNAEKKIVEDIPSANSPVDGNHEIKTVEDIRSESEVEIIVPNGSEVNDESNEKENISQDTKKIYIGDCEKEIYKTATVKVDNNHKNAENTDVTEKCEVDVSESEKGDMLVDTNEEIEIANDKNEDGTAHIRNEDFTVDNEINEVDAVADEINENVAVASDMNENDGVAKVMNESDGVAIDMNENDGVAKVMDESDGVAIDMNKVDALANDMNEIDAVANDMTEGEVTNNKNVDDGTVIDQNEEGAVNNEKNEADGVVDSVEVPLNRKPVVLPGGIVMPPPRVETVNTSWKTQHLTYEQINGYCKRLFKFKTVNIMHFKRWADRRKYTKARKTLQYPTLPEGTKLITIPAQPANGTDSGGKSNKRDWVMNMNGRSYLSVFHEYVRRALQKQPVYEFVQLENASTPYQATVYIGGMQYGVGHGSSKRQAKSAAARASIHILIPEMKDELDAHAPPDAGAAASEPDFSFFDYVSIEDPRITEFCAATCEPSPHAILRTCLLRNFGAGDRHIQTEMKKLEFQKIELTMKVGKHTATVVCKNKKTAKQRASQAILQALHPHVRSWGSLLRLYGSRSVKSCKEKKLEEQQITLLQDQARHNEPNYAVLAKLRREMARLRAADRAVVPLGTLRLEADLPSHSGANLNNVDL